MTASPGPEDARMSGSGDDRLSSALDTIQQQRGRIRELLLEKYEPIAVVGVGLRFPGGNTDLDGFADFLREGRSGIGPVPEDRWDVAAFAADEETEQGRIKTIGGGFLDQVDKFDAQFFNISPKEAQYVDPQQRLLLETAWEALESANINPTTLRNGNGGVYVGASSVDYALEMTDLAYEDLDGHLASGTTAFPLSGRLSYFLGLHGPCMSVDTACASALTALHLAVEGLRRGECEVALAAGVNAIHHPRVFVTFSHANMLAPDAQCKTFDEAADGYVRAEGCGVLVLKRLSAAKRDGDTVLGLVRGSAVGQDGDSAGLTVPNGIAQEGVIRSALANARLKPADISYVEAHGTGTPLGDPIEMGAINDVFADSHTKENPLVVGSVKTNLGHMEPASGIVGVIKTLLQFREGVVFPHLNLNTPSPRIPWSAYPVTVPTGVQPWEAPTRRAVVNSFGFAGTIAAAVLEEAPPLLRAPAADVAEPQQGQGQGQGQGQEREQEQEREHVFTLSARTKRSLRRQVERYTEFLDEHPGTALGDLCYTGNVGRSHFTVRMAAVVGDREQLRSQLDKFLEQDRGGGRSRSRRARKVSFLFSGQGAQYPGMGAPLYDRFPVFREYVDTCDRLFQPLLDRSVKAMILGTDPNTEDIHRTLYTQPALFTLEYALAKLWMSWGVRPNSVIGHSIGEVTAATVAEVFTLDEAVELVAVRAKLMQSVTAPGGMAAASAPVSAVQPLVENYSDLAIGAVNSPRQCVVSGGVESLAEVTRLLEERGVQVKQLTVSHAFHSPLMTEAGDAFREAISSIRFKEPRITLISNVTGEPAKPGVVSNADYWARHISEPVLFEDGMTALEHRGDHVFVEIGPSSALTSLARQSVAVQNHSWLRSLSASDRDSSTILRAVAQMYGEGLAVSWTAFHAGREGRKVPLPNYVFDRKRYWMPNDGNRHRGARGIGGFQHPLLGQEVSTPEQIASGVREFALQLSAEGLSYLADHVVGGRITVPVSAHIEAFLALQDTVFGEARRPMTGLVFEEPLVLADEETAEVRTRAVLSPDGGAALELVTLTGEGEVRHAAAAVSAPRAADARATALGAAADELTALEGMSGRPAEERGSDELYSSLSATGTEHGGSFRKLAHAARYGSGLVVGEVSGLPTDALEFLPPPALESALRLLPAVTDEGPRLVATGADAFRFHRKPRSGSLRVLLRPGPDADGGPAADLLALEGDEPVFEVLGLRFAPSADPSAARRHWFHEQQWVEQPAEVLSDAAEVGGAPSAATGTTGTTGTAGTAGTAGTTGTVGAAGEEQPGERHVLVMHGDPGRFPAEGELPAGTWVSFADSVEQAVRLMREWRPTDLCWFWRPDAANDAADSPVDRLRAESEANYSDLLKLVAALEDEGFGRDQRLYLVTERGQWLPGDEAGSGEHLAAASLWGFGHVLLNESPTLRPTLVDLPGDGTGAARLLDELRGGSSDEFQVAYRGGTRYVRRLAPSEVTPSPTAATVRPDRTYLITGGLGAIGLVTARKLVDLGARHLTLVGRRGAPAADVAHLKAELDGLAEVTCVKADICDPQDMAGLTAGLLAAPHPLGGIFHAAGVLADGAVSAQSWETFDTVFRPKVYGTWLLHEAAMSFPELDFFVCYSSAAAVLGGATQSNYAAANSFMDHLMHWRAARGLPALSVNWGPWSEVGMSARLNEQVVNAWLEQGIRFFPPAKGMRALAALLGGPVVQIGAGECDWERFVPAKPVPNALYDYLYVPEEGAVRALDIDSLRGRPRAERLVAIDEFVRVKVAAVLYIEDPDSVDSDVEFGQLGLDSLVALELRNALESAFRTPLPASVVFDHPSAEQLSEFLDTQLVPTPA
ncbi:type I polyketide synthase [Streptomyces sp. NPDC051320]|uniref:type I polyketide synthase n=1 Tax=Streptomyces sp. NPDC051320 TaxID=3154644 RepID=UPI003433A80E